MDGIIASIILPPSRDLLELLDVCYMLTLVVYMPFFALTVGSLILSIFYRLTAKGNEAKKEFSRELLLQIFPERHYGILYGAVPVFTVAVVYAQSLYKAEIHVVQFILTGIITAFLGFYFFYKYRTSLRNEHIQDQVIAVENLPKALLESIENQRGTTVYTASWMMIFAPLFILLAVYQIIGSMEIVLHPEYWASTISSWQFVIHTGFWWKFLFFLSFCFAITGAGILLLMCTKYESLTDEAYTLAKTVGANCGLYGSALLPILGLFYAFSLSEAAFSKGFVVTTLVALVFIFLATARMSSAARAAHRRGGSVTAFAMLLIAMTISSLGDTIAKKNATMEHTESVLSGTHTSHHKNESNETH